ncbi:MAG: hypothetical protein GDA67_15470 [Nitrospira sp. CR1.3]|nr:hypothetical protein [Nitrospira sp. CR1.3]
MTIHSRGVPAGGSSVFTRNRYANAAAIIVVRSTPVSRMKLRTWFVKRSDECVLRCDGQLQWMNLARAACAAKVGGMARPDAVLSKHGLIWKEHGRCVANAVVR